MLTIANLRRIRRGDVVHVLAQTMNAIDVRLRNADLVTQATYEVFLEFGRISSEVYEQKVAQSDMDHKSYAALTIFVSLMYGSNVLTDRTKDKLRKNAFALGIDCLSVTKVSASVAMFVIRAILRRYPGAQWIRVANALAVKSYIDSLPLADAAMFQAAVNENAGDLVKVEPIPCAGDPSRIEYAVAPQNVNKTHRAVFVILSIIAEDVASIFSTPEYEAFIQGITPTRAWSPMTYSAKVLVRSDCRCKYCKPVDEPVDCVANVVRLDSGHPALVLPTDSLAMALGRTTKESQINDNPLDSRSWPTKCLKANHIVTVHLALKGERHTLRLKVTGTKADEYKTTKYGYAFLSMTQEELQGVYMKFGGMKKGYILKGLNTAATLPHTIAARFVTMTLDHQTDDSTPVTHVGGPFYSHGMNTISGHCGSPLIMSRGYTFMHVGTDRTRNYAMRLVEPFLEHRDTIGDPVLPPLVHAATETSEEPTDTSMTRDIKRSLLAYFLGSVQEDRKDTSAAQEDRKDESAAQADQNDVHDAEEARKNEPAVLEHEAAKESILSGELDDAQLTDDEVAAVLDNFAKKEAVKFERRFKKCSKASIIRPARGSGSEKPSYTLDSGTGEYRHLPLRREIVYAEMNRYRNVLDQPEWAQLVTEKMQRIEAFADKVLGWKPVEPDVRKLEHVKRLVELTATPGSPGRYRTMFKLSAAHNTKRKVFLAMKDEDFREIQNTMCEILEMNKTCPVTPFLKDEPYKLKKLLEGRTRSIFALDWAMSCVAIASHLWEKSDGSWATLDELLGHSAVKDGPVLCGVGNSIPALIKAKFTGVKLRSADVKGWDKCIPRDVSAAVYHRDNQFARASKHHLVYSQVYRIDGVDYCGDVSFWLSGAPATLGGNSVMHYVIAPHGAMVQGDDLLFPWSKRNHDVVERYRAFGLELILEDDTTFCGLRIGKDNHLSINTEKIVAKASAKYVDGKVPDSLSDSNRAYAEYLDRINNGSKKQALDEALVQFEYEAKLHRKMAHAWKYNDGGDITGPDPDFARRRDDEEVQDAVNQVYDRMLPIGMA